MEEEESSSSSSEDNSSKEEDEEKEEDGPASPTCKNTRSANRGLLWWCELHLPAIYAVHGSAADAMLAATALAAEGGSSSGAPRDKGCMHGGGQGGGKAAGGTKGRSRGRK